MCDSCPLQFSSKDGGNHVDGKGEVVLASYYFVASANYSIYQSCSFCVSLQTVLRDSIRQYLQKKHLCFQGNRVERDQDNGRWRAGREKETRNWLERVWPDYDILHYCIQDLDAFSECLLGDLLNNVSCRTTFSQSHHNTLAPLGLREFLELAHSRQLHLLPK